MAATARFCTALAGGCSYRHTNERTSIPNQLMHSFNSALLSLCLVGVCGSFWKKPLSRICVNSLHHHLVGAHSGLHTSSQCMRTINQIIRKGPIKRKPKKRGPIGPQPQMKGVILQLMIRKPKKPNSAQRKCCRVRLSNGKEMIAYIPGERHTLQEHNVVLVRPGRTQDLPGVRLKCIRGKYDFMH